MAESVYGGTWASGDIAPEIVDFELMHPDGMGWSWPELERTPLYVRRYCWDLVQIKRRATNDALAKARASRA